MAENVHVISGAEEIDLYFRNQAWATALADMNNLQGAFFTDIDRYGYKGWSETPKAGSMRKFMEDSSGETNIPAESVLFADADGRATFDADFTFDGTDLVVGGNTVLVSNGDDEVVFTHGWSLVFTDSGVEWYKDGSATGVFLIS